MTARRAATRKPTKRKPTAPTAPTARLQHDLEVHQVELEMQNEELRGARTATEAALQRYTEVFEFAPIGYVTLDHRGTIRDINRAGCELLGHPRSLLAGKPFVTFVASRDSRAFDELLVTARRERVTARGELEVMRGDRAVAVRMSATALRREATTFLIACEDFSDRRIKELELERTTRALELANQRKDEFLAMLSHELRNPLSPIRTSVELLQLAPPGSPVAADAVDIIDRSAAHLTRIVDDLLDVTRIARGKFELQRERVDLSALVRDTVADHAAGFARRGIQLELQIKDDELWVHGDPTRLVQTLSNMLANAEKFTQPGGRVTVTAEREQAQAIVRVHDTGIGIAPELIDLVFEPFVQAAQALDRGGGGLGLGLAVARAVIELHGGRTAISSPGLGRGTEASFALPTIRASRATTAAVPAKVTSRRVLVIEDKPDTAEAVARGLRLKGHVVETAGDGITGIAAAARFGPDVVLCDVGLPHLDGYAIARRLRSSGAYLVALTGYARSEDIERALEAGFACHLAKPASLEEIERVISRAPRRSLSRPG